MTAAGDDLSRRRDSTVGRARDPPGPRRAGAYGMDKLRHRILRGQSRLDLAVWARSAIVKDDLLYLADRHHLSMNLRDLEYAVCLAGEGQFRRAAVRCHVSQPTLSTQIAKLEDELGLQLFERGPRAATPTVNGRAIIRQAQIVLDEVERLKALARAGQDPLQGPFHLGVIPTAGPYLLPPILPVLRESWPGLRLLLREEQTTSLLERLRTGSLDAAILSLPLDGDDLRWENLLEEPILVALPRDHRLAHERRIAPRALIPEPIVLLEEGHCLRDQSLSICDAAGLGNRRDEVQAAGLETLRQMVMAGIGIALIPELAALPPFGAGQLAVYRRFEPPEPKRTLVLAWRRSFPRGDALQGLASGLRGALMVPASVRADGRATDATAGRCPQ